MVIRRKSFFWGLLALVLLTNTCSIARAGIRGDLIQITPFELTAFRNFPALLTVYIPVLIARRFGSYFVISLLRIGPRHPWIFNDLHIDKAWQGLHYLLTGAPEGGKPPLSYVILGRTEIGPEGTYGRTRYLTPEQVKQASAALEPITVEELRARIDLRAMYQADIYAVRSEYRRKDAEQQEYEYYGDYFGGVKAFYKDAAQNGNAMLFFLS